MPDELLARLARARSFICALHTARGFVARRYREPLDGAFMIVSVVVRITFLPDGILALCNFDADIYAPFASVLLTAYRVIADDALLFPEFPGN
jgi:hypothetical protein